MPPAVENDPPGQYTGGPSRQIHVYIEHRKNIHSCYNCQVQIIISVYPSVLVNVYEDIKLNSLVFSLFVVQGLQREKGDVGAGGEILGLKIFLEKPVVSGGKIRAQAFGF